MFTNDNDDVKKWGYFDFSKYTVDTNPDDDDDFGWDWMPGTPQEIIDGYNKWVASMPIE